MRTLLAMKVKICAGLVAVAALVTAVVLGYQLLHGAGSTVKIYKNTEDPEVVRSYWTDERTRDSKGL